MFPQSNHFKQWSNEDKIKLKELVNAKVSNYKIALIFERKPDSIPYAIEKYITKNN